jgi:hypothetical protein
MKLMFASGLAENPHRKQHDDLVRALLTPVHDLYLVLGAFLGQLTSSD